MGITISTTIQDPTEEPAVKKSLKQSVGDAGTKNLENPKENLKGGSNQDQDEDEDEDSVFPTYWQRVGPCKRKFAKFEKCVEDADKNEKWLEKGFCFVRGLALMHCVNETHKDYCEELDKMMNGKHKS